MESLETVPGKRDSESVTVYGTQQGSHYMKADFPDEGVYISDGYAEKYNIKTGDTIWLKETYGDKTYSFCGKRNLCLSVRTFRIYVNAAVLPCV